MNTIEDLKNNIKQTWNIDPVDFDGETLKYHSIEFKKNTGSILLANKETADMWTVNRTGHSVDYYRTEELTTAVSKAGSLPYYFVR